MVDPAPSPADEMGTKEGAMDGTKKRMKRASYRDAVAWIAENDEAGADDAGDSAVVARYVSTALVADVFCIEAERVARDVVRYRVKAEIVGARR